MIQITGNKYPIQPLIDQVNSLDWTFRSIPINYTDGYLLGGPYTTLPEFADTPLGEVLESIEDPGEARLLRLSSGETYTAHADPDDRWHVPVVTNSFCYLIDFDKAKMYHLPADGRMWYMDTSNIHVASNFGPYDRIHLNIRKPLPEFSYPGFRVEINGGDCAWKQTAYNVIMPDFNKLIKAGIITGFRRVTDRVLLLNCDESILTLYVQKLTDLGFSVELKYALE